MMKNRKSRPPIVAEKLFELLTQYNAEYDYAGALREIYVIKNRENGSFISGLWYWRQVLIGIPQFYYHFYIGSFAMFFSYLKLALRNIRKDKAYSFINITGLVIGITSSIIIFLFIQYELSYDSFHENADDIYRAVAKEPSNVYLGQNYYTTTQGILAPTLMEEYPEVLYATRFRSTWGVIRHNGKAFDERGKFADEYFLKVFTFPLTKGDVNTALQEPYSVVLSEGLAGKMFPGEDPVGKTVNLADRFDLTVTGVHQNVPENSHFHFEYLVSFATRMADPKRAPQIMSWKGSSFITYMLLESGSSASDLENKLVNLVEENVGDGWSTPEGEKYRYILQPLKKIHLHSNVNFEMSENGDIKYIYIFTIIGFLIILIACINYINLSTARSLKRFREIGIRKVAGAHRIQLFWQMISESSTFALFALFISLLSTYLVLPVINTVTGFGISFDLSGNLTLITVLFGIMLFIGLFSGLYPAIYVSAFRTIDALRNSTRQFNKKSVMRNSLVIGQFCISIVLIIFTIVVLSQLSFIKSKDQGYDLNNTIQVRIDPLNLKEYLPSLKQELLNSPNVLHVSSAQSAPMLVNNKPGHYAENSHGEMEFKHHYAIYADFDYLDLFNIEVVNGRNFSVEFGTDEEKAVIINESAAWEMGFADPLGKRVKYRGKEAAIVGVIKDFHFASLHHEIEPLIFFPVTNRYSTLYIKLADGNRDENLKEINRIFSKYNAQYPFSIRFVQDLFNEEYSYEHKLANIFICFAAMAIFIATLGLFGLISYVTEQSKKEIGIRKVLGARITDILYSQTKDLIKLVILANIISWPVAWFAADRWLQGFAYKTDLNLGVFLLAMMISIIIASFTVSSQSFRAAVANPVNSLRHE